MGMKGRGLLFLILKCGVGVCQSGPAPQRLGSGDVLVVDSAAGGRIQARENSEMVFWFFTAEFEHLFPLFTGREICLLQNVAGGFKAGRVYAASSPLAKECLRLAEEVPVQFSLNHRSHVLRIVSAILTAEFKARQPKLAELAPMRDRVLQVFEGLRTDELLSLSVGELARKFNCSRRHLNRLFHQHFGASVAALRMEMRLLKAVSLLVDPDAKIIYVAEKCGFNHLGLFNTCFKKRFGATPSQWRKVIGQSNDRPAGTGVSGSSLQAQGLSWPSEKSGVGVTGSGQTRSLKPVALSELLKDVVAVKNGARAQAYERKEADGAGYGAESRGDRRASIGT